MTMLPCPICGMKLIEFPFHENVYKHPPNSECALWRCGVLVNATTDTTWNTRTPSPEGMEKAVECKKCAADKALDEALDKVFEKVSAMSKAEFDDMIEKHKDGDIAQLLNHSGMFDCYDVHEERDKMEKALRDVLAIGYNKDCMFCGFKDKIALQATGHSEAD